jgi:imidazolonepropionase-like amidohydrolase
VYGRLPKDILHAVADEARSAGLPFAGHVTMFLTAEESAAMGQRSLEHANALEASYLDGNTIRAIIARGASLTPEERAREMRRLFATDDSARLDRDALALARMSVWFDPTLVTMRSLALPTENLRLNMNRISEYTPDRIQDVWKARLQSGSPPAMVPVWAERLRLWERAIRVLHRRGARILVGSDSWNPYVIPGFGLHDEMELLVQQGMTPLAVLRAATRGAAEYLEFTDSLGAIAANSVADLVLLDADPLTEIGNVRRVNAVVVDGRLYRRPELDELLAGARTFARRQQ